MLVTTRRNDMKRPLIARANKLEAKLQPLKELNVGVFIDYDWNSMTEEQQAEISYK